MFKKIATYICILFVGGVGFFGMNLELHQSKSGFFSGVYFNIGDRYVNADVLDQAAAGLPQNTTPPAQVKNQDTAIIEMINKLITGWNTALALLTVMVSPAIILASWLMSPDWTSGDLFGIRPLIHDLWIMVSNVTYFIYAILLIFIALATIFNSDKYGYKQLLPKLALGIIMVPLSWWFIQFTISLASIVTASVMNIPMETLIEQTKGANTPSWIKEESIPVRIETSLSEGGAKNAGTTCPSATNPSDCTSPLKILDSAAGVYSPLLIYGYSIFKVDQVKKLNSWSDYVKAPVDVLHQVVFGSIMFLVFGLLVLALIFMLMVRAIKLWFYAIFSPLMTLKFVIGDGLFGKEGSESFDIKEFIGLAFVPALVGISLSFGLMIISVLQSSNAGAGSLTATATCTVDRIKSPGCELIGIMGVPANKIVRKVEGTSPNMVSINEVHIGGVIWAFKGKINSAEDAVKTTNNGVGVISSAGGLFGTLIIDIIALIFIWVAFMAAKGVTKVAQTAFAPFEQMGKKIGELGMSLPKYAPILPGGMSVNSMGKVPNMVEQGIITKDEDRFKKSGLYKVLGGDKLPSQADMTMVKQDIANESPQVFNNVMQTEKGKRVLEKLMENAGKEGIEREETYKQYMEELKKLGKDKNGMEKILVTQGMNGAQARIIAERIEKGGADMEKDRILLDAWKATAGAKGSNSNSGNNTSASIATIGAVDAVNKSLSITIAGTAVRVEKGNISDDSLNRLKKGITDTIDMKPEEFIKAITNKLIGEGGLTATSAEETAKKIADGLKDKFKTGDSSKPETPKPETPKPAKP